MSSSNAKSWLPAMTICAGNSTAVSVHGRKNMLQIGNNRSGAFGVEKQQQRWQKCSRKWQHSAHAWPRCHRK
eukprot:924737-Rhodomonas_salina.2